jgi:hypothetical protein
MLSVEGLSKSAIARVERIGWNTVDRWVDKASGCSRRFNDQELTGFNVTELQADRRMAVRHGDDQIASVLNRLGYTTGKGNRWNQTRVATARKNHSIAGQKRALADPEKISLNEAARLCGVSHRSIERLVEAGLLKREQVAPRAPWEIRRSDLGEEPVRSIIERLRRTGKLVLRGGRMESQHELFLENQTDNDARHHE